MDNNQILHKPYQWYLHFEEKTWHSPFGEEYSSLVNEENHEVWRRYLVRVIKKHMKPEVMTSPEFLEIEAEVNQEKDERLRWDEWRKHQLEVERYRRAMERPRIDYIPKGLTVDYDAEYGKFFMQEVTFVPKYDGDFMCQLRLLERWHKKSIPQILAKGRPDAAYVIALGLCKHIPLLIQREDIAELIAKYKKRIGKLILDSYTALADTVEAWNNEEKRHKVCQYIKESAGQYQQYRGMVKKLLDLMPTTPIEGEPVPVTREMNEEEEWKARVAARKKEQENKAREEAEKEAQSVIPLNEDYETCIFNRNNIGWDCDLIWHLMLDENKTIERMVRQGQYMEAALKFMQMTKSMCRHFVKDEHYNFFDDIYSPEYAIDDLMELFEGFVKDGKLPEEVKEYLRKAWKEMEETECHQDYGLPRKELTV